MELIIQSKKKKKIEKHREIIFETFKKTLSFMKRHKKSCSILVTDEPQIRALNKKFRHIDYPTDVLAFPAEEKDCAYLGDIVISFTQAEKQAKTYNEKLEDELARLVAHGTLHLLGETDYDPKSKKKMWDKQEKILKLLKQTRPEETANG